MGKVDCAVDLTLAEDVLLCGVGIVFWALGVGSVLEVDLWLSGA